MRIAMWSGPRNLSTAMMYSFGARDDFEVMDEPFYAAYLNTSGADHPLRDEIISEHETDPNAIDRAIKSDQNRYLYMKHMPHHMLDGFPMDWAETCVNIHLIRHPARVIASYGAKRETVSLEDIGYVQQARLFDLIGGLVIDSTDVRADPEGTLSRLCDAIGLPFDPAMLCWPSGPKPQDGVWAKHWYGAVHKSTGFAGPEGDMPFLETENEKLMNEALPLYEKLAAHRLR